MTKQQIFVFHLDCIQGGKDFQRIATAQGPSIVAARSNLDALCENQGQTISNVTAQRLSTARLIAADNMAKSLTIDTPAIFGPAYLAHVKDCDFSNSLTPRTIKMAPLDGSTEDYIPPDLAPFLFDTNGTYALLDGALILGLPERLAASGLSYACLYEGDAAEEFADTAPYIVQLEQNAPLTRALFSRYPKDGIQRGLWADEAGIIVQSPASLHALRRHFRRFIYLTDEHGKRMFFRFYVPVSLRTLIAHMEPEDLADFGTGITRFLCPGKPAEAFIIDRIAP